MSVVGQLGILTIPVIGRGDGRRSAAGRQQANVAALPGKCSPLFRKLFVYPRLRLLVGLAGGGWLVQGGSHLRSFVLDRWGSYFVKINLPRRVSRNEYTAPS